MTVAASPQPDSTLFGNAEGFTKTLLAGYLLMWGVMAISPVSRVDWLIQNAMPFLFAGGLIASYSRFRFSPLSYLMITLFMTLHVIGAHYTYAQVPLGDWMKDALGLSRNCFDRIVHFSFGLLMTYPARETSVRLLKLNRSASNFLALAAAVGFSAVWEILESWLAQIVSPGTGAAYLGAQGDQWDAQNDIAVAFYGSLVCVGLTIVRERLFNRDEASIGPALEPTQHPR
jgi:putative membrane protein